MLKVASGKLKKDKEGNWEFEYDSPDSGSDHDAETETMRTGATERPGISGIIVSGEQGESNEEGDNEPSVPPINLVCSQRHNFNFSVEGGLGKICSLLSFEGLWEKNSNFLTHMKKFTFLFQVKNFQIFASGGWKGTPLPLVAVLMLTWNATI